MSGMQCLEILATPQMQPLPKCAASSSKRRDSSSEMRSPGLQAHAWSSLGLWGISWMQVQGRGQLGVPLKASPMQRMLWGPPSLPRGWGGELQC